MIWQDKGFLLSKNKYNENSVIAEFYTENYGKIIGVIFGASSKKIKNYLLIGNKFHLNFTSNQNGKIGYFKVEIDKIYTPVYFDDQKKLFSIIYAMNLIKILTMENQSNKSIFYLIDNFFEILNKNHWLLNLIFWELKFYKIIGYDINFAEYVKNIEIEGDKKYIVESNKKIIPNFLIDNSIITSDNNEIINGYKVVGDFLDKTILKPNNISYPVTRSEFLNLIK
tara:strand:- start:1250 stop:1924 length:675 start_codon:yes stop_codon:yes gene_type:complete